jgi:ureidoacrylate peracid hydrolase
VGGIVTNGGVASTVRDAHVREFECTVLSDGCAAFSPQIHAVALDGLRSVAKIVSVAGIQSELSTGSAG